MRDRTRVIFGNLIDKKTVHSAGKSKRKYIKKYGDDSNAAYRFTSKKIPALDFIGARKLVFAGNGAAAEGGSAGVKEGNAVSNDSTALPDNALIVGNIRMGFGQYRISIAMASCAAALGYAPYWLDLAGFDATGSKMIREQNDMYSLASRISQKSRLFNHFVWEPLNSKGFAKITYNAKDQRNSELLVPILSSLPKDIPYIGTHVWPAQAAVHAGMTHVVNAIPDNWPMALHLSEGAIHTVQTPFAYLGYKMMNGFSGKPLRGMPEKDLKMVGRYVDHELLADLEEDNKRRIERANGAGPMRFLMTVGGAGAGFDQFLAMVKHLIPYVEAGKAAVFINFGDHIDVYEKMQQALGNIAVRKFFNQYGKLKEYTAALRKEDGGEGSRSETAEGITVIYNKDIFKAVYSTNLLMPESDVLITKPSELAYYPIPKLFMKHIGGHEVYGAIASQEAGDGTFECPTAKTANRMIDVLISDHELYAHMCRRIDEMKAQGYYDGAYECVRLAVKGRE